MKNFQLKPKSRIDNKILKQISNYDEIITKLFKKDHTSSTDNDSGCRVLTSQLTKRHSEIIVDEIKLINNLDELNHQRNKLDKLKDIYDYVNIQPPKSAILNEESSLLNEKSSLTRKNKKYSTLCLINLKSNTPRESSPKRMMSSYSSCINSGKKKGVKNYINSRYDKVIINTPEKSINISNKKNNNFTNKILKNSENKIDCSSLNIDKNIQIVKNLPPKMYKTNSTKFIVASSNFETTNENIKLKNSSNAVNLNNKIEFSKNLSPMVISRKLNYNNSINLSKNRELLFSNKSPKLDPLTLNPNKTKVFLDKLELNEKNKIKTNDKFKENLNDQCYNLNLNNSNSNSQNHNYSNKIQSSNNVVSNNSQLSKETKFNINLTNNKSHVYFKRTKSESNNDSVNRSKNNLLTKIYNIEEDSKFSLGNEKSLISTQNLPRQRNKISLNIDNYCNNNLLKKHDTNMIINRPYLTKINNKRNEPSKKIKNPYIVPIVKTNLYEEDKNDISLNIQKNSILDTLKTLIVNEKNTNLYSNSSDSRSRDMKGKLREARNKKLQEKNLSNDEDSLNREQSPKQNLEKINIKLNKICREFKLKIFQE